MKLLCCCNMDDRGNPSWQGTTKSILDNLKIHFENIDLLDYQLNPLFKKLHSFYGKLFLGQVSHRDRFDSFFSERNFVHLMKNKNFDPDIILHISRLCVPGRIAAKYPNYLYLDATAFGPQYINLKRLHERFKKEHIEITKKYADRLKGIFTFNEWTSNSLIRDFGVSETKIHNIGFGANLNPYYGRKDFSNGKILIVLRKGLEKSKGLYLLLDAFQIAFKQNPTLELNVVGTTAEKTEGVNYYEGFPREKTVELFQQSSLYAMPAIYEANGMVYPEALACKTPILGLDQLAFPEFSGHGKYGFSVKPDKIDIAEKILYAFKNPGLLEKMGNDGQKYVLDRYLWDIVIDKMMRIISN